MKAVSYSLFRHPAAAPFVWRAYVRGLYFNVRMNRLLYPGWVTAVFLDDDTATRYGELFAAVGAHVTAAGASPALCEGMLWRMIPIFEPAGRYSHVLCRDADAITTYREACAVTEWLGSGKTVHALHDDPMHTIPLMGGMSGFDCQKLRAATGFSSWREMITTFGDLSQPFSDQTALNAHVYPRIQHDMLTHDLTGGRTVDARAEGVDPRLWESNLTCRHIGSAGIVELETIRFFKRFDPQSHDDLEKRYPEIFYWHGERVGSESPGMADRSAAAVISVCYTSARPELVPGLVHEWIARAGDAETIEFVVTIDAHRADHAPSLASLPRTRVFVNHGRPCCVDGWNLAARKARGSILVQCSDDLHPPTGWDVDVRGRLADGARAAVLAISDGLTAGVQFIPHAIVTRRYYAELGYLFHDGYWSMWSDNELSAVAHRRSAVIEALDIRFAHAHGRFHDDVRSRHEAAVIFGEGDRTFRFRAQHGFEPWKYSAFVGEDGDSDGIYSPNWRTRLPAYWSARPRSEALYLELHRDSHARRLQRFGWQQPIDTLQALISTEPGHRAALDLLAAELARQGISFLVDDRVDLPVDDRRARLLARSSSRYVTFMDDDTWMSHNYGELVADAIANNGGSVDVILHDAVSTDGDGTPRPTFFSFDRQAADLPDCRLRPPDQSMVWRRELAAGRQAACWARIHGLLRFHETRR